MEISVNALNLNLILLAMTIACVRDCNAHRRSSWSLNLIRMKQMSVGESHNCRLFTYWRSKYLFKCNFSSHKTTNKKPYQSNINFAVKSLRATFSHKSQSTKLKSARAPLLLCLPLSRSPAAFWVHYKHNMQTDRQSKSRLLLIIILFWKWENMKITNEQNEMGQNKRKIWITTTTTTKIRWKWCNWKIICV